MDFPTNKDYKWLQLCAYAATLWSTCGKRQYYAVVLDPQGRVVGTGYNGSPPGIGHCNEGHCPRLTEGALPGSTYETCIAIHAEANALLHSDRTARLGGTLIVNGPPCWGCGKEIAGSGIKRLVYLRDPLYGDWDRIQGLLEQAGVVCIGVEGQDL